MVCFAAVRGLKPMTTVVVSLRETGQDVQSSERGAPAARDGAVSRPRRAGALRSDGRRVGRVREFSRALAWYGFMGIYVDCYFFSGLRYRISWSLPLESIEISRAPLGM